MDLTSMQAAYWTGGHSAANSDGVVAHLYSEFDGPLMDLDILKASVRLLFERHPMLRLAVAANGVARIAPVDTGHALGLFDLRHLNGIELDRELHRIRDEKSHQRLPLETGHGVEFHLSILPGNRQRLHVDIDMISADPSCFGILLDDLAKTYSDGGVDRLPPAPDYAAYRKDTVARPEALRADRAWWTTRFDALPPAPKLPRSEDRTGGPLSTRLSKWIAAEDRAALQAIANSGGVTLSSLMLALFTANLSRALKAESLCLNLPRFHRTAEATGMVGDFSDLGLFAAELRGDDSLKSLAVRCWSDIQRQLSHTAYPGPALLRDLSRHRGAVQRAPVVFTAGLATGSTPILSDAASNVFGDLVWVISQGPQVALDVQVARMGDRILVNWDIREDMTDMSWIRQVFDTFCDAINRLARNPGIFEQPLKSWILASEAANAQSSGTPLKPLQKAYLLGRGTQLPLGGIAMQDFQMFRGTIPLDVLRARLAAAVQANPALRTYIDPQTLTQTVRSEPVLNLETLDYSALSKPEAEQRLAALQFHWSHEVFSSDQSPWGLIAITLPDGDLAVMTRFDALILDAHSIAELMRFIFAPEGSDVVPPQPVPANEAPTDSNQRSTDAEYWQHKLQAVSGPPRLPYKQDPEQITQSRYNRQSLVVPHAQIKALWRRGAKEGLFQNTTLTALILEVLARWTSDLKPCVAVPVSPSGGGSSASNASSFVALAYDVLTGNFADRAKQVQRDILEGLQHTAFSGVDLNRMLLNKNGGTLALPVVITSGLSWPAQHPDSPMQYCDGLTPTPQTALDIRLTLDSEKNLVLSFDYAQKALSDQVVSDLLAAIYRAILTVSSSDSLKLDAADFVDLTHYRKNDPTEPFECSRFLERIRANLFDGDASGTALICARGKTSYHEFGRSVLAAIAGLRSKDMTEGDLVAVCLPRSPDHIALQVACALEGIRWVPIDASSPAARLHYLLDACSPDLVVTRQSIDGHNCITPKNLLSYSINGVTPPETAALLSRSSSAEPAYYLFTSGTTGKPKCVAVSNRGTSNTLGRTLDHWQVDDRDVLISVTPLHHDMSVFDVFGALTAGATLLLPAEGEEKDAIRWAQLVRDHAVSIWTSVPAILEMLMACSRCDDLRSLRLIAQGGDYIKPTTIASLRQDLPKARLISLGGPTETTIWSIWHDIEPDDVQVIPYGHPLQGCRYFVCNELGEHCPTGVTGRIHTTGVNLSPGYMVDGTLTQTDFVTLTDDQNRNQRAFKTGDQGFYRPDGTLIFAARINGYVKIRGVRVSLADVENELSAHKGLNHVAVVDLPEAEGREATLLAICVANVADAPKISELRAFARRCLPETHVPSRFVMVDALPLSANGKLDRKRARELAQQQRNSATDDASAGRVPTAADLVLEIYLAVLDRSAPTDLQEDSPLIALGLRPSHLAEVARRLNSSFGASVTPGALVGCKTARQVSDLVARAA
ncbi:amino acid adenylation domain-containing protein [Ruegeria sp. Ofav3-42]|uniref:amino acid adenylation domain-containing protein n=1 Tax=Ruegeria sp. Ofav3-42 TaxID=2917759 RepID=UPI001EF4C2B4|nr:amino acid adenylation domain-containing protein [Ruegeria sp. Ofav3-42]MCG7521802.1 amino acid adenylation domain-containing protein [Ruegeria sp. Ofav3-42]